MKRCIITGAAGLIGSFTTEDLMKDHEVVAVTRPNKNIALKNGQNLKCLPMDLTDPQFISHLPSQMDYVIHLAQSEHFRDFPSQAEEVFAVNTLSCLKLLEYARKSGVKTFVLASSGVVYGEGNRRFSENEEIILKGKHLGFYYTSKLCAEAIAENYASHMNVIILRFFFVYGPGQRKTMLIPRLVQNILDGKSLALQGEKGIKINPTYVLDAVQAIRMALTLEDSNKINVAGPEILSLREIGQTIGTHLNIQPRFDVQSNNQPNDVIGNIHKMTSLLGAPKIKFSQGVLEYIKTLSFV